MYAVIIRRNQEYLPTVVNMNSVFFPEFMMAGYEVLKEGTEKEMESYAEEIMQEMIID